MKSRSSYLDLPIIFFAFLMITVSGCSHVNEYRVTSSIVESQVTQYLPSEYAVEYLRTIEGNCDFEINGVFLIKDEEKGNLVSYNNLKFFIEHDAHNRLKKIINISG